MVGKSSHYRDDKAIIAFGKRIRSLRQEREMTIEQLANNSGLEVTQLSRIERGEVNTTISYIFRLAEIFGISAKELLDFKK